MADLTVRRGGGGGAGFGGDVDPFRMVRESMRRMQDLFRDPFFELDPIGYVEANRLATFVPDFEVRETKDGLVFQADLPGVNESDVDVTVVGNRLRISGKRELNPEFRSDTWYAAERAYGSFTRTFILPEGCDTNNVDASLNNGVLTIRLAKRAESQPRRISLGGGQQQRAIEGHYAQGPFQQSEAAGRPSQTQTPPQGYGQRQGGYTGYTGETPEAGGQQGQASQGQPGAGYERGYEGGYADRPAAAPQDLGGGDSVPEEEIKRKT